MEAGCYFGIDISPRIILDALGKIDEKLSAKLPHLYLVEETDWSFLPKSYFDYVNAHSVFSHLPMDEIEKVLKQSALVMKDGGKFDFTYLEANEASGDVLNLDFYYTRKEMIDAVSRCGLRAEFMSDWKYSQMKIRAHKP